MSPYNPSYTGHSNWYGSPSTRGSKLQFSVGPREGNVVVVVIVTVAVVQGVFYAFF